MTNEQLAAAIKARVNTGENMLQLYNQTKAFISSIAWRYRGLADLDDLEQEGYLALYDAIDGYDPAAGCQFITYAGGWIAQRIRRYIQNNGTVRIPIGELEQLRKVEKLEKAYQIYLGRKPNEREIAGSLDLTLEQVRRLKKTAEMTVLSSLDGYVDEDGETTLGDLQAGPDDVENSVLDAAELAELQATIWPIVDALPDDQAAVIRARFRQNMTLQQAGDQIGVTVGQARSLEGKALRELRQQENRLCAFLPEVLESQAYRGSVGNFNRTWTSSTERVAMKL